MQAWHDSVSALFGRPYAGNSMQTKTRHAMQRETLWEYVREVWQASAILIQQEGQKLNPQQRDSAKTIHNGITRLRQALREADHDAKSQPARHPTCGSDWNHALLSPLTSVRGFSQIATGWRLWATHAPSITVGRHHPPQNTTPARFDWPGCIWKLTRPRANPLRNRTIIN